MGTSFESILSSLINSDAGASSSSGGPDPDTNTAAFLAMIRASEGTSGEDGYRALFGYTPTNGKTFSSFDDHPRLRFAFTQTDGKVNYTTAAGAYQFTAPTWDRIAYKLDLTDFSPENQDRAALELVKEKGALEDVRAGRFDVAVNKLGKIWASLPSANVAQPRRTWEYVRTAYASAGGAIA
jgi:lysozyme